MEKTFKVMRPHLGDKMYNIGDIREANENDVAHLVAAGVLVSDKAKAESGASKNKQVPQAPKNKAEQN